MESRKGNRSQTKPSYSYRVHLQGRLSSKLDMRPLAELPSLPQRPSSMLPSLLVLRPGVDMVETFDALARCFGVGSILLRRLVMALAGLEARRAAGLSSVVLSPSSSSTICACREERGVPTESDEEPGVVCVTDLFLAGVEGDCIGLASGRRPTGCCAGVVDAGRVLGGGESAEVRLRGLRTGIAEWLETLRSVFVAASLR